MSENGTPNDPEECFGETNTQVRDETTNGIQEDFQAMEPGEAPKPDDGGAKNEDTLKESQDAMKSAEQEEKPQPSKLKAMWGKLGLDPVTLILMFK
jgi:hypothetical protein